MTLNLNYIKGNRMKSQGAVVETICCKSSPSTTSGQKIQQQQACFWCHSSLMCPRSLHQLWGLGWVSLTEKLMFALWQVGAPR